MEQSMKQKKFDGEKLRNMRLLSGRTLEEVAAANKFDTSSLSLWENGRRPGPRNMKKLSEFYKVPIAAFFAVLLFVTTAWASVPVDTIYGEARGESLMGKIAVGEVIRNRVRAGSWYGHDVEAVCLKPYQFSFWNDPVTALRTVSRAKPEVMEECREAWLMSSKSSLTNGSTLYCRYDSWPDWRTSRNTKYVGRIGHHVFYREK